MLYVFHVNIGSMISFDDKFANQKVCDLQIEISKSHGVSIHQQVLLISGGDNLDTEYKVYSYCSGLDSNPIFLFSKNTSDPPPAIHDSPAQSDLKFNERINGHAYSDLSIPLPEEIYAESCREFSRCEQLVRDQHLQHQGWSSAIANLDDIHSIFKARFQRFIDTLEVYKRSKDDNIDILKKFPDSIRVLGAIPLLDTLLESQPNATSSLSLLDWINDQNTKTSLTNLSTQCIHNLEKYGRDSKEINTESENINSSVENEKNREVIGLGERLADLEKLIGEARKIVEEQKVGAASIIGGVSSDYHAHSAGGPGGGSIVVDPRIAEMVSNHSVLCDMQRKCLEAKQDLCNNLHCRLGWLMMVEASLVNTGNKVLFKLETLNKLNRHVVMFKQICSSPAVYVRGVEEVVRRRQYTQRFLKWSSELSKERITIYRAELEKRQQFLSLIKDHFLLSLFPGIEDMPSDYATSKIVAFDTSLPDISLSDIKYLVDRVPQLTKYISDQSSDSLVRFRDLTSTASSSSHAHTSSHVAPHAATTCSTSGSDSFAGGVSSSSANVRSDTKSSSISSREVFDISLEKEDEEEEEQLRRGSGDQASANKPRLENRIGPPKHHSLEANDTNTSKSAHHTTNPAHHAENSRKTTTSHPSKPSAILEFRPKLHSSAHSPTSSSSHSYTSSSSSASSSSSSSGVCNSAPSAATPAASSASTRSTVVSRSCDSPTKSLASDNRPNVHDDKDDDEDIVDALEESMAQFDDAESDSPQNVQHLSADEVGGVTAPAPAPATASGGGRRGGGGNKDSGDLATDSPSCSQGTSESSSLAAIVHPAVDANQSAAVSTSQTLTAEPVSSSSSPATTSPIDTTTTTTATTSTTAASSTTTAASSTASDVPDPPPSIHRSTNTESCMDSRDACTFTMTPRVHCIQTQTSLDCQVCHTQTSDSSSTTTSTNTSTNTTTTITATTASGTTAMDQHHQCSQTVSRDAECGDVGDSSFAKQCPGCVIYADAVKDLRDNLNDCKSDVAECKMENCRLADESMRNLLKQVEQRESLIRNFQARLHTAQHELTAVRTDVDHCEAKRSSETAAAKLEVKETEERMTAELEQHEIETKDLRLKLANLENDHKKYIEEMESNYEDKVLTRISKVQEIHDREMESQRVLHKQLLQQQLESRQQLQAQYQANLDKAIDREASLKVLMDEYKVAKEQSQLKCSNLQDDIIELNTKHNDEFSKIKLKYDQLNENYQENILELEKQKKSYVDQEKQMSVSIRRSMAASNQSNFNEALKKVVSDKDKIIEKLQRDNTDLLYAKNKESIIDVENKIKAFSMDTSVVQIGRNPAFAPTCQVNSESIFTGTSAANLMGSSVDSMDTLKEKFRSPESELVTLKKKVTELTMTVSMQNLNSQGKVSVTSCNVGDISLFCLDEKVGHYVVFTVSPTLYFLHADCLPDLSLHNEGKASMKSWFLAEILTSEYCMAKKLPNRYNLSIGTKFYRVKARTWNPHYEITETQ